jgi:Cys-tRNA(Pro)/Cys-tRNA(Cys) deacylase
VAGQGTPATALLARQRVTHRLHTYDVEADTPNYGAVVADSLGIAQDRVFKTLVTEVDGALTVAIVPVSGDVDLKALAGAVGGKRAGLADRALAERTTGYVRGGISPLGQRKRLRPCSTPRPPDTPRSTSAPVAAGCRSSWTRPT